MHAHMHACIVDYLQSYAYTSAYWQVFNQEHRQTSIHTIHAVHSFVQARNTMPYQTCTIHANTHRCVQWCNHVHTQDEVHVHAPVDRRANGRADTVVCNILAHARCHAPPAQCNTCTRAGGWVYVCMHVCMHVCMYVSMYVCLNAFM